MREDSLEHVRLLSADDGSRPTGSGWSPRPIARWPRSCARKST